LQVRSDVVGDISPQWLRNYFSGKLLYSLQSTQAGGAFHGTAEERNKRLIAASRYYDLVELEAGFDLRPSLLEAIPAEKRLIVWRGAAQSASHLRALFEQIMVPAHSYCMITRSTKTSDGLQPLLLLNELHRTDLTAFCEGPHGLWSRLLAPYLGASFLFGQVNDDARLAGEFSVHQLIVDYGFPALRPVRKLLGMVGNKIFQSPSPRLHNAAYQALDYPALFLPFHVDSFQEFWRDLVESPAFHGLGIPMEGFVMVSPHKEAALAVAGKASEMARKAGSTNVMVCRNGCWEAHTTDPESISDIPRGGPLKAAVIGCGGAGRAVAAALQQSGAEVTLVNRGRERGLYASDLLGLPFTLLSEFWGDGYNLLVNATPVGKNNDRLPFDVESLNRNTMVVDLAYGTDPTPLVAAVLARGGTAIDGFDVLLTQVRKQFHILAGKKMPDQIGREMILNGGPHHRRSQEKQLHDDTLHTLEAC